MQLKNRKRGRPAAEEIGVPIQVRVKPSKLVAIDAWRARQPDLPGRPEAIRRLVDKALATGSAKAPAAPVAKAAKATDDVPRSKVEQIARLRRERNL